MATAPRIPLKSLLIGLPLGLGALAIGFAAEGLIPGPTTLSAAMVSALQEAPPAGRSVRGNAREDLQGVAAQRLGQGAGLAKLAAPELALPQAGPALNLEIRIALLDLPKNLQLGSSGGWWLRSRDGRVLNQGGPGQSVSLAGTALGQPELWLEPAREQTLLINGQAYAGRLRLVQQGASLLVINHLPLEDYIASVVGSEMPSSWNLEALKAQAVAARSYAVAHMARPPSQHWHLGNTTRWQAYRGLDTVNGRTRTATATTAGLILSYQGGIVESLYAANSQISWEAHRNLGASMSQEGANSLANQGQSYPQILGHYYQGASLARLKTGAG
ncbi:MAG: SpoIID/LytB domain-containing protein [Cyanobacteria bacterium]|nr:SpoIID/LytB domain-containing protein [Cyanobacteriota bacterium]